MNLRRKMTYTTTVLAIFLFFCPKAYAHGSAFCKALVCNTVYVVLPSYYNTALSWSHGHAEEKKNCIGNYRIQVLLEMGNMSTQESTSLLTSLYANTLGYSPYSLLTGFIKL